MTELRERLDVLLVKNKMFQSRERAKESIAAGLIYVNGKQLKKCGAKIDINSKIEFKGEHIPYVSRGGLKLEKALADFNINLSNKSCLDIGASTGGFTDCMLQNGAEKVYAIDVGTDQLHEDLRNNSRVVSMEQTNVRYIKVDDIGECCDFASIDVSFISLQKVLPSVVELLNDSGQIMALIKPQFEAGKSALNKKGVIKDKKVHKQVVRNLVTFINNNNLKVIDFNYSPVKGPNGNIEYLINITKEEGEISLFSDREIDLVIDKAHDELK